MPRAWLYGNARNLVWGELDARAGAARHGQIQGRRLLERDDITRMQEQIDAAARSREL